jgi:hypothetical protein
VRLGPIGPGRTAACRACGNAGTSAAIATFAGALAALSGTRYNDRGDDVRLEVHDSADSIAVGADGLEAGRNAEACTRSAREHRPVRIEEVGIP